MSNIWKLGNIINKLNFGTVSKQFSFGNIARYQKISAYSRTMEHMPLSFTRANKKFLARKSIIEQCRCSCGELYHTDGERSMVDFLSSEIKEERKSQRMSSLPQNVDGFAIKTNGAEMKLTKKGKNETITISFSVNDSVDTEDLEDNENEMKSRPSFDVEIERNQTVLHFGCSFTQFMEDEDKTDVFQIDEVSLYEGERSEKNYAVAADILDSKLYDFFMQILSEKGITSDFMEKISDVATHFEHSKYISLLEGIHKFSSSY